MQNQVNYFIKYRKIKDESIALLVRNLYYYMEYLIRILGNDREKNDSSKRKTNWDLIWLYKCLSYHLFDKFNDQFMRSEFFFSEFLKIIYIVKVFFIFEKNYKKYFKKFKKLKFKYFKKLIQ